MFFFFWPRFLHYIVVAAVLERSRDRNLGAFFKDLFLFSLSSLCLLRLAEARPSIRVNPNIARKSVHWVRSSGEK